jgi:cell division septation protein DedD
MRWTTIGLSAGTQQALSPDAPDKSVDWKKRIATVWIPAILGLGLITAFAYVGVRIVAGKPQVQPTASPAKVEIPVIKAPANIPAEAAPKPAAPKPAPKSVDLDPKAFTLVTPQPGERYLQVAAVTPHMVLTYVDTLRQVNLDAVVAPGPTPDLLRILVGPFSDQDSMNQAKTLLEAAGKSPIIRSY